MKLAFIDKTGCLHSVVWTVFKEGHDVLYWIQEKDYQKIGNGLVEKADSEKEIVDFHPDIVYVYKDPRKVLSLTGKHLTAFGSSLYASKLEDERFYAVSLADKYGIQIPRTFQFTNVEDAKSFLKTQEGKTRRGWVFKVSKGETDASTTHVTESKEHLHSVLDYEQSTDHAKSFILQERIEGIEISIEGWFDYRLPPPDGPWIKPINSTLERKRLMSGDNGPMIGCMGSIVWAWPSVSTKLFRQTLEKITPHLKEIKYVGPLDGNFIIDYKTKVPYFLEWTPRLGWNAFEAFMYGLSSSTLGEFLVRLGSGELTKYAFHDNYLSGVRLFAPQAINMPIFAPYQEDKRLFPKDVWYDTKDDTLKTVGTGGPNSLTCIMEACSSGYTIKGCMNTVYENVIPQVTVTDLTFRNDIGEQAIKDVELLEAWGYLTKKDFSH